MSIYIIKMLTVCPFFLPSNCSWEYKVYAVYEECLGWMTEATAFFEVFVVSELLDPHYSQIHLLVLLAIMGMKEG